MMIQLEHANMHVEDIDSARRFLQTAFPEFRIRKQGQNAEGRRWMHLGTDQVYFALNEATAERKDGWQAYSGQPGINHLGFEVADVDAIHQRLSAAGYKDSTYPNAHPHRKRVYFHDTEGNDWEFVQYFSDQVDERNDYDLPDD